jgi:hypothetical protein
MDKTTKNCRPYRSEDNDSTPCHLHSAAPRLLYDRKEAARQLSISIRSLDYAIASKKLETRRNGSRVLVTHASLVRYASANHYEAISPAVTVETSEV